MKKFLLATGAALLLATSMLAGPASATETKFTVKADNAVSSDLSARRYYRHYGYRGYRHYGYRRGYYRPYYGYGYGAPYYAYAPGPYYYRPFPFGFFPFF